MEACSSVNNRPPIPQPVRTVFDLLDQFLETTNHSGWAVRDELLRIHDLRFLPMEVVKQVEERYVDLIRDYGTVLKPS